MAETSKFRKRDNCSFFLEVVSPREARSDSSTISAGNRPGEGCKPQTLQLTLGFTASGHFYGLVDDSRGMSYFPHNKRESS